eukprot:6144155-Lingulodinium_polyedra.AAC.1
MSQRITPCRIFSRRVAPRRTGPSVFSRQPFATSFRPAVFSLRTGDNIDAPSTIKLTTLV